MSSNWCSGSTPLPVSRMNRRTYAILARLLALRQAEVDEDLIREIAWCRISHSIVRHVIERELIGLSAHKAVGVLIEDLHWADQSSIDLLNTILPLTGSAADLVCAIRSAEPAAIWEKSIRVFSKACANMSGRFPQPLSTEGSRTLIAAIAGRFFSCLKRSRQTLSISRMAIRQFSRRVVLAFPHRRRSSRFG